MRVLALAGMLLLSPLAAQATTLVEVEPNDCFCEATPGGNENTTALSGTLTDGDFDLFRFDFATDVVSFSVTPLTPDIFEGDTYRLFAITIYDAEGMPLAGCDDCFYDGVSALLIDAPAGTYYVELADYTFESPLPPTEELPADVESLGLGAYTLAVQADVAAPEPASLALLGMGLAGLAAARRRRA